MRLRVVAAYWPRLAENLCQGIVMDEIIVYDFQGREELDELNVEEVARELLDLVDRGSKIILDFSSVKLLTSTHLAKLIVLHKRVRCAGNELRVCGLKRNVREVFEITQLDKVFRIYENVAEARRSF
jgi:anti-anti-sigma factor